MKLHIPQKDSHKGQNGKLLVIGGSRQYHGAPMFSLLAARRFVDLMYFLPGEDDPFLVSAAKSIPEAIVEWDMLRLPQMDCVLFGIGLADAGFDAGSVIRAKRLVIDGDGLARMEDGPGIPEDSIITPHEGEFRMLFGVEGKEENVRKMAAANRCVILKKGPVDIIADGRSGDPERTAVVKNAMHNPGMTKGGTGDVLAGLVAALHCKNDAYDAAVAGAMVNGMAGNMLMKKYGHNYCAGDLADALPEAYEALRKKGKI